MLRFECNQCGQTVQVGAESAGKTGRCPSCGAAVVIPDVPVLVVEPEIVDSAAPQGQSTTPPPVAVSAAAVRKGTIDAEGGSLFAGILILEIVIVSIGLGAWSQSWFVFGGCLVGMCIMMAIKPLAVVLGVTLTILAGVVGWVLGYHAFESVAAGVVLALLGCVITAGTSAAGITFFRESAR